MFINYFKLALRLLARSPFFAIINVVGLSIGFASFFALWEHASAELKSDQFHPGAERTVRLAINWRWTDDGGKTWGQIVAGAARGSLLPEIAAQFPEVESYLRIMTQPQFSSELVGHDGNIVVTNPLASQKVMIKQEKVAYADPNLFRFFSIPLVYGHPDKVLAEGKNVALSRSAALKYFGPGDPTDKLLRMNDTITLRVSGVYEDLPHNSHLDFQMVISDADVSIKWEKVYWNVMTCYLRLRDVSQLSGFQEKLSKESSKYYAESLRIFPNGNVDLFIQPLAEMPYNALFYDTYYPKSRPFLLILAFVAFSVLAMAWINYINLSVSRTTKRLKEVATRKISGAGPRDLVMQFVVEAAVINVLALALACTFIQVVRIPSQLLFNIHIVEFSSISPGTFLIFLVVIAGGVLLCGLYPALISIDHHPRALFRIGVHSSGKRIIPSILTTAQFIAAIVLILLCSVVVLQLNYILDKESALQTAQVVVIEGPVIKPVNYGHRVAVLKEKCMSLPAIERLTVSQVVKGDTHWNIHLGRIGSNLTLGIDGNEVDENFADIFKLKFLAGRNFVADDRDDVVVISRLAAERLGFNGPAEAVGQVIKLRVGDFGPWRNVEVAGVIEDYRLTPFFDVSESNSENAAEGRGIVLSYSGKLNGTFGPERLSVSIVPGKTAETINAIEQIYGELFPGNVFTWYFLDDHINRAYDNEKTSRNQISLFAVLATLIACMGLLGMISFKIVDKTKEIGIRKVLGARLTQIGALMLNSTIRQAIIAIVIGMPLAYYLVREYLSKFSDRISLNGFHFAMPVLLLLTIMLVTVAGLLWKASRTNPVDALKYE